MSFRICTIGCGGIATGRHGPSYARYAATHPDTELVACCDLDEDRAVAFRDSFGFTRHYTDLDAMLDAERPDAVCLVSPVAVTCELSCRILEAGFPLMMEKPPGMDVAETDRMMAAARASGAPTQVAFNRRHAPLVRRLKELLPEPAGIQHIRYEVVRVRRAEPDFSTTAIHGIDAARFLAGSDYAHVRFHCQDLPEFGPGVCNILMDCTFASGATGHLSFCPVAGAVMERAAAHARDESFLLDFPQYSSPDGTGSLVRYERGEPALLVSGGDLPDGGEQFVGEGFYGENESFFDDVRAGRRPAGDVANARQSVLIAQCIRERRAEWALA